MAPYTVLISGANRGIGKGLLEIYLAKPNHTVIAFNRDPSSSTSKALANLPAASGSKLVVVKYDAGVETSALDAVKELQKQGITHLDVVIANAAIADAYATVKDLKIADLERHIRPNVFGVVWLYQATQPLLLEAQKPKFITIGSSAGWLENQHPMPNAAYAPTKAMVHWLTKRINGEEEKIAAWVIDPGWVQTDMGNLGATTYGYEQAPVTIVDSTVGTEKVIDVGTKESHGGKLWGYDGKVQQW